MGGGGGVGGRKLVGAVRVVGVVTQKPLGISLAPPTRGVGGYIHIYIYMYIDIFIFVYIHV